MTKQIPTTRGEFNIRVYGNTNNPPLLLVHGWPQTSYCWHHCATHLSDFYVIAPDLRGMGDSNRELDPKYYTKDEMAKDIFAIADVLGLEQFALGGHDWGGAIVQEMAILYPERIRKLIIINMIIINNPIGKAKAVEKSVQTQFRSSWYQSFLTVKDLPEALIAGKEEIWVRFFSRGITNPIPEDAIQEYIRCYKIPNTITTAANIYRAIPLDLERWTSYDNHRIKIPTLIIHGYLDPVIIKDYVIGVTACYPKVSVQQIKGGHFVVDEQPAQVAGLISNFLRMEN